MWSFSLTCLFGEGHTGPCIWDWRPYLHLLKSHTVNDGRSLALIFKVPWSLNFSNLIYKLRAQTLLCMIAFSHINVWKSSIKSYYIIFLDRSYNWVLGLGHTHKGLVQHWDIQGCTCLDLKMSTRLKDYIYCLHLTLHPWQKGEKRKKTKNTDHVISDKS